MSTINFLISSRPDLTPLFVAVLNFLQMGSKQLIREPLPTKLNLLMRNMARSVHMTTDAGLHLVSIGFGVDALRLARTNFETAVNAHFLVGNEQCIDNFIDYEWVMRRQFYQYLTERSPNSAKNYSQDQVNKIEAEWNRIKDRYPKKSTWTPIPFSDRVKAVKAETPADLLWCVGSSFVHNDAFALRIASGADGDALMGPSAQHLQMALNALGFNYAIMLDVYQKVSGLGFEDRLQEFWNAFNEASRACRSDGSCEA